MTRITLKGTTINTVGSLPAVGSLAPAFTLTGRDLAEASLADYSGKRVVLNIFPSLDTPTCAMSVRRFNAEAAKRPGVAVLCISMDLPFAQARFCGAEGLANVVTLSGFRNPAFGERYGVRIADGPLAGLYSRAVVVIDGAGRVLYTEQVPEIAQEPDYDRALAALG
jgi:thioredoxin-dependent peroxiredoxin